MRKEIELYIKFLMKETEKAVLVSCPKKSKYAGYMFWSPKSNFSKGSRKRIMYVNFSYFDNFTFNLFKLDDQNNVIAEVIISVDEFEEMYLNRNRLATHE